MEDMPLGSLPEPLPQYGSPASTRHSSRMGLKPRIPQDHPHGFPRGNRRVCIPVCWSRRHRRPKETTWAAMGMSSPLRPSGYPVPSYRSWCQRQMSWATRISSSSWRLGHSAKSVPRWHSGFHNGKFLIGQPRPGLLRDILRDGDFADVMEGRGVYNQGNFGGGQGCTGWCGPPVFSAEAR